MLVHQRVSFFFLTLYIYIYLVGGLEHVLFFHMLGIITPTDELIFFRGVGQPPTSIYIYMVYPLTNWDSHPCRISVLSSKKSINNPVILAYCFSARMSIWRSFCSFSNFEFIVNTKFQANPWPSCTSICKYIIITHIHTYMHSYIHTFIHSYIHTYTNIKYLY